MIYIYIYIVKHLLHNQHILINNIVVDAYVGWLLVSMPKPQQGPAHNCRPFAEGNSRSSESLVGETTE